MKAYSLDLRQRIVEAVDSGEFLQKEIATMFSVSTRFIYKLLRQRVELGHIAPLPHGGGRRRLFDAEDLEKLGAAVEEKSDVSLKELQAKVHPHNRRRLKASTSTISRTLKTLGLTRKKEDLSAGRGR